MERKTVIVISGDKHRHVVVRSYGDSLETCLADAQFAEKLFAPYGHEDGFLGLPAYAEGQTDFETGETHYKGFGRYNLRPGDE